ncbi:unnamed protein product, partial [Symbiodinium sp. CCMP2456]
SLLRRLLAERELTATEAREAESRGELQGLEALSDAAGLKPGFVALTLLPEEKEPKPPYAVAASLSESALELALTQTELASLAEDLNGQPSVQEILSTATAAKDQPDVEAEDDEAEAHTYPFHSLRCLPNGGMLFDATSFGDGTRSTVGMGATGRMECAYCHFPHSKMSKPDGRLRQRLNDASDQELLATFLPFIFKKAAMEGLMPRVNHLLELLKAEKYETQSGVVALGKFRPMRMSFMHLVESSMRQLPPHIRAESNRIKSELPPPAVTHGGSGPSLML